METLIALFAFLFCIVLPVALAIAFFVWLGRRWSSKAALAAPTAPGALDEIDRLLERWASEGDLTPETAAQMRALVERERQARWQPASAPAAPVAPEAVRPLDLAPTAAPAALPAQAETAPTPTPIAIPAAEAPPAPPRAPRGERLWDALLSLRTRQTLLFLGAFLLLISALILVIFNWNSFSPILQFGLLAGVCGGFWAGGAWVSRRAGLERTGAGLQAVGGVLVPVVAFALSRPGLLDLEPRGAWLLASALSLPIYALAAWRLRQQLFVVAGCLSAASAVLATLGAVDNQWLPLALAITLACYLPLAGWLKRQAPDLAAGPRWVAHIGLPATLAAALLLTANDFTGAAPLAATLWAGAAFYLLATWRDRRAAWIWAAAAIAPAALLASLAALQVGSPWWGVAPALLALGYLGLALAIEPRDYPFSLPGYAGAVLLALIAIAPAVESPQTARWTLPLLLAGAATITLAYHRSRLTWLREPERLLAATLGLAGAGVVLPAWALALIELTALDAAQRGLALLPIAALYVAGAYSWPGRLRRPYDLTLQALGVALALGAGVATLLDRETWVAGMAGLTAFWLLQSLLRRHSLWAAAALGNALLAGGLWLARADTSFTPDHWIVLALSFTAIYLLGGTLLRGTSWRFWTWPALGWGALAGAGALLAIAAGVADVDIVQPRHVGAVLALAGVIVLAAALWRAAWPGYLVAALLALATLLAATQGFFTAWRPAAGDYGYVLCGLTLGLALLGQALRRVGPRFAYPYEVVGFALLTLAPLPTAGSPQHAALTWAGMALLYGLACWRYRLRWAAAPALLAADLALLNGSAWLSPGGRAEGAGVLLLAAAWVQALIGLWASRRPNQTDPRDLAASLQPAYVVALLSGLGALALASGASDVLALVAFGLALLLAVVGTVHRREEGAWGALALLALGLASLHQLRGVDPLWSMAWGIAEALAVCLIGWAIETFKQPALSLSKGSNVQTFDMWLRPLWLGPLLAALGLTLALLVLAPIEGMLPPLTFALATLGLLLATLAVRRRQVEYAYAAGGALVLAGLCQLYDWGFRQPQWYVIPAGLYLLALAEGLRRFQKQRALSQVVEAGATMLMLGVTFGQSLRAEGLESQAYAAGLCVEALALLAYGVLRQLRVPFLGGAAFFVAGVLWLSVDPLLAANKWVLLGILGLLLVGAYVLLERRQEQLVRAGRAWVERVSGWS